LAEGRLVVATANPGKLKEFHELLPELDLVPWAGEVEEVGDTYEENALLKARTAAAATGMPALGDDSGLEIEALEGAPGLHSKRLAPTQEERDEELWRRLEAFPRPWRARFVAALALAWPDGRSRTFRGVAEGVVLPERRGRLGFGYDPVFYVPEAGATFSELHGARKHAVSHRGSAVRALRESGVLSSIE
jgi:XTP/dITP diphosphohydrolase